MREAWSIKIYCTKASSCVNKLGYLQNVEGSRLLHSASGFSGLIPVLLCMGAQELGNEAKGFQAVYLACAATFLYYLSS